MTRPISAALLKRKAHGCGIRTPPSQNITVIADTRSVIRDPGASAAPFDPLDPGFVLRTPRDDGDLLIR